MERNYAITLFEIEMPRNDALSDNKLTTIAAESNSNDEINESKFEMERNYAITLLEIETPRNDALSGNELTTTVYFPFIAHWK